MPLTIQYTIGEAICRRGSCRRSVSYLDSVHRFLQFVVVEAREITRVVVDNFIFNLLIYLFLYAKRKVNEGEEAT